MNNLRQLLGGVEAGGTKMVCAVAYEPGEVLEEQKFPTTQPEETLVRVKEFLENAAIKHGELAAIGYGTFGPASVTPSSKDYGKVLATPKSEWEGADVIGFLSNAFPRVGIGFDTDVNAAALGEGFAGAAVGLSNYVYVTVGTGIGGGVVIGGQPLHGSPHPETGHMRVPLLDDFSGVCPFHGDCLEGLASGTAIGERWGVPAQELGREHEAWDLEAGYLAAMVQNYVACYAPERIILGGGVMEQPFLLEQIRQKYTELVGGYWTENSELLVSPALGNQAGITGALLLAKKSMSQ